MLNFIWRTERVSCYFEHTRARASPRFGRVGERDEKLTNERAASLSSYSRSPPSPLLSGDNAATFATEARREGKRSRCASSRITDGDVVFRFARDFSRRRSSLRANSSERATFVRLARPPSAFSRIRRTFAVEIGAGSRSWLRSARYGRPARRRHCRLVPRSLRERSGSRRSISGSTIARVSATTERLRFRPPFEVPCRKRRIAECARADAFDAFEKSDYDDDDDNDEQRRRGKIGEWIYRKFGTRERLDSTVGRIDVTRGIIHSTNSMLRICAGADNATAPKVSRFRSES